MKSNSFESKSYTVKKDFFDVSLTLDCGQAFRWSVREDGTIHGIAGGRVLDITESENEIAFSGTDEADFILFWKKYFDLDRDYASICRSFCEDAYLKEAIDAFPGIRILRQDSWEALCSFIISQNNNIPRIKGIVSRLCEALGDDLGNGDYSFPSAETVAGAGIDALSPLRAGFRAKYIIDAAQKVANGDIDFNLIEKLETDEAAAELKKIKGVGDKIAACTLLYGFGKLDAFPVDVWMKRVLSECYPDGLPECMGEYRGIAQQYLFHHRRNLR